MELDAAEQLVRAALEVDAAGRDVHRFVLAHGTAFRPVPRPADIEPGTRHDHFRNAFHLARGRPDLRYCEGFTLPRGWSDSPNRHAWCIDGTGAAIDPSPGWTEPGGPLRDCYFGVAIPLQLAAPYADGDGPPPKGVLYELTGRMDELAAQLGVGPV
jgi:hypothetical protein